MQLPSAVNPIGSPFVELQSVDSTNKYAMTLLHEASLPGRQDLVNHGMAIFSYEQTEGKGQRGKKWISEKGNNIALSVIINPYPLVIRDQFKLSICIAVSVHEFFSVFADDETKIKWPNDIYWRDRKAGGILIENVVRAKKSEVSSQKSEAESQEITASNWAWAVVGIGLNVNQTSFPADLPNPVSLKQITGKSFDPVAMAKQLCSVLDKNFGELVNGGFEQLFAIYQTHLYKKDDTVKMKKSNRVFEATILGVSASGQLITHHSIEERFEFGEVEWIVESSNP